MGGCAATPTTTRQTYVVRPHDTLYSIAWRHDVDYRDLAQWNDIGPDYRLSVGQVLVLQPEGWSANHRPSGSRAPGAGVARAGGVTAPESPAKGARAGGGVAPASPANGARAADDPAQKSPANAVRADGAAVQGSAANGSSTSGAGANQPGAGAGETQWQWPTAHSSPPRAVPGGGILVFGRLGQDVRAAGAGRVVYTGSGIRGYGNLIIIKHGDNWLSSYAHNRELLVHEGESVHMGQIVAHMGVAAHQTCALYFEIRLNGKPVDPLRYLPATK